MIAPGAIVICRQTGDTHWVVESHSADGRWRLVSKRLDGRCTSRAAGEGDIVVITPAPTYEVGATIRYHGVEHIIAEAAGDFVTLIVPASRFRTRRGGDHLHIPEGNTVTIPKSDLVLEELQP
jgi:hypothetical protein